MSVPPILYSFRRCPYAIRARMALLVSGAPFEIREVLLCAKPAEMLAASPKGTVPVLVLADGRVVEESRDVMMWALARNDPEDWLAGRDMALGALFDDGFKHHLDRYKYPERHNANPVEYRDAALEMLELLEARLSVTTNLSGETRAFADIAIMPFVRQFAAVDAEWFARCAPPHVRGWLTRHLASPLFERAMIRMRPWAAGDAPILWP